MRIFLQLFFLLSITVVSFAQPSATEQVVTALFDKPDKILWLRHFHGRIDGLTEVTVSLAYDGKRCRGLMTYLRSKEAVQLEGVLKNNLLNLKEINREGDVSGTVKGELRPQQILAEWSNTNSTLASILDLRQVEKEVTTPSFCGEKMWIRSYTAQLPEDEMRLVIQAVEEGQLKGIAYSHTKEKSYRIIGERDENDHFQIVLQDADYRKVAYIRGAFSDEVRQKAIFNKSGEKDRPMSLKLESSLYMGCKEYADYLMTYDITYPKTVNTTFNEWMEAEVSKWVENCRDYSAGIREVNPKLKPVMRSAIRAYGWSEIDYYSPKLISGFMAYDNTWSLEPNGYAFNYDLEKGKEITLNDIFKKDFEVANFVLEYLHDKKVQSSWIKDPDYREWLEGRDFPYFTIRQEGICFCTAYNGIYGRHELTIPYSVLKPYLKRKSPVANLIKD